MATITLEIPRYRPVPLNRIIGLHFMQQHKIKKADKAMIAYYSIGKEKAKGRRRIDLSITLQGRQQPYDYDNAWKCLLDSLVACGMLTDDNEKGAQLGDIVYERGESKTIIRLTDI